MKHRKAIERTLIGIMAVAIFALGSSLTVTWYSYHPDRVPTVTYQTYVKHLAGDVNLDGKVTETDVTLVTSHMNKTDATWGDGDVNFDGTVDGLDLSIVLANMGNGLNIAKFSTV